MRAAMLAVLFLAACSGSGHLSLPLWTLSVDGQPDREVVLPAVLHYLHEHAPYRLTTDVDLPESLHGRPITLTIGHLRAPAVLRADGVEVAAIDGQGLAPYHAWRLPASQARVHLELEVDASSFFAADFATAPEVGVDTSPSYRVSRAASGSASLLTVVLATLMALIYAVTWLLDRRCAAHGWFALQAILVTPAFAAVFGGTPAHGVTVAIMYFCMIAAVVAGAKFMHAEFALGPLPRLIRLVLVVALLDFVMEPNAFSGAHHLEQGMYMVGFPILIYVIVRLVRVARRSQANRVSAVMFAVGWGIFFLSSVPDLMIASHRGDLVGGVYGSSVGAALYVLVHSLVLARERAVAARRQEELNRELKRQVAERSHELAEALTRLQMAREASLVPGAVVDGRYRIRYMLERGGMGHVYACERTADGAPFALKVVRGEATPDMLARFAREAEIAARLEDPRLIAVHDVGVTPEGMLFLIMDLMDGSSLEKARARFGDVRWGLRILKEVAQGLAALHEKGVVHRDLKPANVLIDAGGARIADFGIAALLGAETQGYSTTGEALAPLTRTGMLVGTPSYMAPELIERGSRDPKPSSDLYSFGVLAYEVLAGRRPVGNGMRSGEAKPLLAVAPTVPAEVAALIDRALALDPAARPAAGELARALAADLPANLPAPGDRRRRVG